MPTTPNIGLIIPNTGDMANTWGTTAVNPNMQIIDAKFGAVQSLALSAATSFNLTGLPIVPPNVYQCANALIRVTGTLGGNCFIGITVPGYYIIENLCTNTNSFFVSIVGNGVGCGAIPGKKQHMFFDGSSMDYVNMRDPGESYDLVGATSLPVWMAGCTKAPYLLKDGATYPVATYPALAAVLGNKFGGDGVTTFGVPDERSRMRIAYDTDATGRVTTAVSGINGATMGSAGGNQNMQLHSHGVTDPQHAHSIPFTGSLVNPSSGVGAGSIINPAGSGQTTGNAATGISIQNAGAGGSQNMPPSIVSFLALIKT